MNGKLILCLDFDGVIHSYTSGWKGPGIIPDPPVEGFVPFLEGAREVFEIHIFSSRSLLPGGLQAMKNFTLLTIEAHYDEDPEKSKDLFNSIVWDTEKPPAFLTIDDRVFLFRGEWPKVETLREFKPWNKE